jgi:hypothetical protein
MIIRASAALIVLSLACAAFAEPAKTPAASPQGSAPAPAQRKFKEMRPPAATPRESMNLRLSFKLRYKNLESSGNFIVQNGTQANYVLGGEQPFEIANAQGKGIEFKKHGAVVNVLPVIDPNADKVDVQWQSEISGPLEPETSLKVNPVASFQVQTEFIVPIGKTIVLVDEPDRRIEARFEPAP